MNRDFKCVSYRAQSVIPNIPSRQNMKERKSKTYYAGNEVDSWRLRELLQSWESWPNEHLWDPNKKKSSEQPSCAAGVLVGNCLTQCLSFRLQIRKSDDNFQTLLLLSRTATLSLSLEEEKVAESHLIWFDLKVNILDR